MTQFYQITLPEIIDLYKESEITTSCAIRLYIKVKFARGWKIVIDRDEVMETFGISIHAFRRAIAKLKDKLTIFVKSVKKVATAAVKKVANSVNNVAVTAQKVAPGANQNPQNTNKTNTSSDSPYIRSNIDHISLSERVENLPEEEREKFLFFANQRVDELPKRPTLPSKWINRYFDDLYSEFKKSSAPETQKATQNRHFAEWYDLMRQLGHAVGQRVENGVLMIQDNSGFWSTYERKSQSYTLEYLKKCVGGR